MPKKLKILALVLTFALSYAFFATPSVFAVECSDGTTAEDSSSCPESLPDLCSSPNSQNTCAPVERIVVSDSSAFSDDELASEPTDEPPTEIIASTTPISTANVADTASDIQTSESLWPVYLSLGALAFAILLIMILNIAGRRQS